MANYLDSTGLQSVLKSLNENWMGSNGILGYTTPATAGEVNHYAVLRGDKKTTGDGLGKLYIDATDIWAAIGSIQTDVEGTFAFKNIKVGDKTIEAESVGDTLTLAGDDMLILTADTTNDKVTFTHAKQTNSPAGSYGSGGTVSGSQGASATFNVPSVTVDAYGHITAIENKQVSISIPTNSTLSFGLVNDTNSTDYLSYDGAAAKKVYFKGTENTTGLKVSQAVVNDALTYTFENIPATTTKAGVVSTGDQSFAGAKTFTGAVSAQNGLTVTGDASVSGTLTVNKIALTDNSGLDADTLDGHDSSYFAVKDDVNKAIEDLGKDLNQKVTGLFEYKGTIGTGGTVTSLPSEHKVGDVYYVKTKGTYAGVECEVGDMIICVADGTSANNAHWNVVNANWTAKDGSSALAWGETVTLATVGGVTIDAALPSASFFTSVKATSGTISGAGNALEFADDNVVNIDVKDSKLNLSHANSGVTAADYGDTAAQTPSFGGTFSVPSFTVDAKGHLTAAGSHNVTIPSTSASTSAAGLMSSEHVSALNAATSKLKDIAANATYDSALTAEQIKAAFNAGMGLTL